jgi:hypothetical protein
MVVAVRSPSRIRIVTLLLCATCGLARGRSDLDLLGYAPKETLEASMKEALAHPERHRPRFGKLLYLGPFAVNDQKIEPGEPVNLEATYESKIVKQASWKPVPGKTQGVVKRIHFAPTRKGGPRFVGLYFFREIHADSEGWFLFRPDINGNWHVYLNGKEVEKVTSGEYRLDLQAGRNELLFWARRYPGTRGRISMEPCPPGEQVYHQLVGDFGTHAAEPLRCYQRLSRASTTRGEVAAEALDPASVVKKRQDPLQALLRRTEALARDLRNRPDAPDLQDALASLADIRHEAKDLQPGTHRHLMCFFSAHRLRRLIALSNPLLDFDQLIFATHHYSRLNHMCDQYFGYGAVPGGSIYRLEDIWSDQPRAVDLLAGQEVLSGRMKGRKLQGGSFLSLELSYDAEQIAFAWTRGQADGRKWTPESTYHIFKADVDGSNLVQLTDGPWNDFDPCFLPGGRIAFISERRGGFGRCHGRAVPTYTLHSMLPDGRDIITLSYHETNEWHPSVTNDGMIIYTRWDYVDRDSDVAHHPWICYPDGRDPRSYHGNYPIDRRARTWMELSVRAIPDSPRYVAVAAPHHDQAYGSLILLDQRIPDDNYRSQIKRITPEVRFPESEGSWRTNKDYGTPWPLSEKYYLAVYDDQETNHGVYLVDAFGNKILIYQDPSVPALDPIPLRPRRRPPVIPSMTQQALEDRPQGAAMPEDGTVAVIDVYDSDFPWPEGTEIRSLRIVQLFPKATASQNNPRVGHGLQSLVRGVLGTVPVEADGSAYFRMPAGVPVYFQALAPDGTAIMSMKSDTYLHPGEELTCLGCHEPKHRSTPRRTRREMPLAVRRSPSPIQPELQGKGAYPVFFPKLVQPVLDAKCVSCHAKHAKAPALDGKTDRYGWSRSFHSLKDFAWAKHGGNGSLPKLNKTSTSIPNQVGARASKLYQMLRKGHHKVKLTEEELRRITLWLDTNSNFYGAYLQTDLQREGQQVMPSLE